MQRVHHTILQETSHLGFVTGILDPVAPANRLLAPTTIPPRTRTNNGAKEGRETALRSPLPATVLRDPGFRRRRRRRLDWRPHPVCRPSAGCRPRRALRHPRFGTVGPQAGSAVSIIGPQCDLERPAGPSRGAVGRETDPHVRRLTTQSSRGKDRWGSGSRSDRCHRLGGAHRQGRQSEPGHRRQYSLVLDT